MQFGINVRQTLESSDQGQIENSILLPSLWEGLGEGRSYGKEKSKLLVCGILFGYRLVAAPLP